MRWLHRAIESFRLPRKLVGRPTPLGPAPRRLTPVFRDRDELPASGDLGHELRTALSLSRRLVVVCSPNAARSLWVNEEILAFKRIHGEAGVLALIVAGEPGAAGAGKPDQECFPPALRFSLDADGALSDEPAHPIAADMRREGDGRRSALLKLIAGIAAVPLDELVQREAQRRLQRVTTVAIGLGAALAGVGALAFYANTLRIEADHQRRVAERQTATARAASAFMVGTFSLSNPVTENPRTLTALTVLNRSAQRVQTELVNQPSIKVELLDAVGQAYNNLGLFEESRSALEAGRPAAHAVGPPGAALLLTLAETYTSQGAFPNAKATLTEAEHLLGPDVTAYPQLRGQAAQIRARVDYTLGESAAADRNYQRALAYYQQVPDLNPQILAWAYTNYGLQLSEMGDNDRARATLLKAAAIYRRATGERSRTVGQAYTAISFNELASGHLPDAKAAIDKAVAILSFVLDRDNPILASALSQRGQIQLAQGSPKGAVTDLAEAAAILQRAYKGPHYRIGIVLGYLALAQSQLGETQRALATLDEAKRNYDESYKSLNVNHGDLLVQRAKVLQRAGRLKEARADCAAGLDIIRQKLGADDEAYKGEAAICAKI